MGKGSDFGHDVTATSLCIFCEVLQVSQESQRDPFSLPEIEKIVYRYIYLFTLIDVHIYIYRYSCRSVDR